MSGEDGTREAFLEALDAGQGMDVAFGSQALALSDDGGAVASLDVSGEVLIQFAFCIAWDGRAVFTLLISAPSPDLAADTVAAMVARANEGMRSNGRPGLWHAWAGACAA